MHNIASVLPVKVVVGAGECECEWNRTRFLVPLFTCEMFNLRIDACEEPTSETEKLCESAIDANIYDHHGLINFHIHIAFGGALVFTFTLPGLRVWLFRVRAGVCVRAALLREKNQLKR